MYKEVYFSSCLLNEKIACFNHQFALNTQYSRCYSRISRRGLHLIADLECKMALSSFKIRKQTSDREKLSEEKDCIFSVNRGPLGSLSNNNGDGDENVTKQ